ncbi:MAG: flagellar protein FlgN [Gammaproteobacteria bacterium]|nr:flagellar protein FlgN [Gammaproteobacteria bacterium]
MMTSIEKTIGDLLLQQKHMATTLLALLDSEHTALAERDEPSITAIASSKQQAVMQLEQLKKRCDNTLSQHGLSSGKNGIERLIQNSMHTAAERTALTQHWQQLKAELLKCQRQNQINGSIIAANRHRTRCALGILSAQSGSDDNLIYGENGESSIAMRITNYPSA